MGRKRNNSFVDILGAILKAFFEIFKGLFRLLVKIIITFGLYVPALYAVFGVVLYYVGHFDPFDFKVYSVIYLSGGVACVVCAFIITIRNVIVKPFKNAVDYKHEMHTRKKEEWKDADAIEEENEKKRLEAKKELELSPPVEEPPKEQEKEEPPEYLIKNDDFVPNGTESREQATSLLFDWVPGKTDAVQEKSQMKSVPKKEVPEIYFSKLQPNILVHEYSNRFELFKVIGDKTVSVGVEYK